jgi:hypothetical protein
MIAKILGGMINLIVYASAATMIAVVIMLCHLWSTWHMDRGRLIQMLAIAQGLDLFQTQEEEELEREPSAEQPSMQEFLDARLSQDRDLEMRETALQNGNEQLRRERRQLTELRDANQRFRDGFLTELAQLKEGAQAEGRKIVGTTLESIEPEQAKAFLLDMLDKEETEEVVILLIGMEGRKRSGILETFETVEERAQIADVLRLIRQGHPKAAIAEEVSQKVAPQVPAAM